MKISSASKKVLASALSAAMVVAFAPAAAFAADQTPDTSKWTEQDFIDAGAIAKSTVTSPELKTSYYFSEDELNEALGTASANNSTAVAGTVKLLKDVQTTKQLTAVAESDKTLTLDLNGHTLSTEAEDGEGTYDMIAVADKYNSDTVAGKFVVKNGTLSASDKKSGGKVETAYKAFNGIAALEDVTADEVGEVAEAKGTVKVAAVDGGITAAKKAVVETGAIAGKATVNEGASLTATASDASGEDVTAVAGGVEVKGKDATVSATATAKGAATAIAGGVEASNDNGLFKNVKVTAKAKSTASYAVAVQGEVIVETLEAAADSATAGAFGVVGKVDTADDVEITADGKSLTATTANITADGSSKDASVAVLVKEANIAGGTVDGKLAVSERSITGGSYTDDPSSYVKNTTDYDVSYSGGVYTVSKFKEFSVGNNSTSEPAQYTFMQSALQTIATNGTLSGVTFAEGWDAAKLLEFAKGEGSGKVKLAIDVKAYNEKTATDEQKAAKKAIDEAVKADLQYTDDALFKTVTATIQYTKKGAFEPTVIATVDDLGTATLGMQSVDNAYDVTLVDAAKCGVNTTAWQYVDGKASKASFKDSNKNGKHDAGENLLSVRHIPTLVTVSEIDEAAIKDAAKGDNKPDTPAAEKATQGIEVDQKSKTVKLAKKASKTKKAASFNLGATAQTGLSIAKASGSSKVTVSSTGKVTLKKGVKKGTYKATVTINAAATDAYYAAAKTVTVKFVVKK